jgi:hypothetical protein
MVLVGLLALAGFAYLAIFTEDFPQNIPGFMTRFITKVFCVVGVSSLICVPAFLGLQAVYRKRLADGREESRRLATRFLESRLAQPSAAFGSQGVGERRGNEPMSSPASDLGQDPLGAMTRH